jgi:ABC-type nitrate/sulfonate/bicarbonate transport system substrate-binding protein
VSLCDERRQTVKEEEEIMWRQRSAWLVTSVVLLVVTGVVAGCGGDDGDASSGSAGNGSASSAEQPVVRLAAAKELHEAPYFELQKYADKYGFKVKVVELPSFADKGRALQNGDVDAALLGMPNIVQFAESGAKDVKVMSGGWWGQQWLVAKKDSGIQSWEDLAGKTIGSPPGSYAQIVWQVGLKEHNLSEKVKQTNTTFDPTTIHQALKDGAYDGVIFFAPSTDEWAAEGLSYYPTTNFLQDTALGSSSGFVIGGKRLVDDPGLATKFMKAVIDMQNAMNSDHAAWAEIVAAARGVKPEVAKAAVERGCMGYNVEVDAIKRFAALAPDFGVTKQNTESSVGQYIDLGPLKSATGASEDELTKPAACAP